MRGSLALVALGAVALTASLSGCVADAMSPVGQDCSQSAEQEVAKSEDFLLPASVPAERPQVTATVREGQGLSAIATWTETAGNARVVFDGPTERVVQTDRTWVSTTNPAPAGTYTLSLEGPAAWGVTYTLMLQAFGCTPA